MTDALQLPAVRPKSIVDVLLPRAQVVNQAGVPGPTDDYWYEPRGPVSAGQMVTGQMALTFSGCWAATNAIAGLFGALPCKTYRSTAEGRVEAEKHPNYRILGSEPNEDMDSFVFWEMMTQWWVNYGYAPAEKQVLNDSGTLFALWPVHPSRAKPEIIDGQLTRRWLFRGPQGTWIPFEQNEVFNIVGHLSDNGMTGKGVITYAAGAIGVGLAQQKYEGEFYSKGGRPSGVLLHKGTLSDKARADLRREWRTIHAEGNEIAVLFEGTTYQSISVDPDHAKLMEAKLGTIQDMCRFYDLPPHVLYELSKGTFANTEEMNRFLVSQPFYRRLVRVEKACNRQLFTEQEKKQGYYVKFNLSALLRGTPKEQAEIAAIELANGFISQDEYRERQERNKLPDGQGQEFWMKRDMAPMKLVAAAAQKEIDKPAEIPGTAPTPGTPPTPPTPGETANRLRELRATSRRLITAMRETKAQHQGIVGQLYDAQQQRDTFERRWNEATNAVSAAELERDAARQTCTDQAAQIVTLGSRITAATNNLEKLQDEAKTARMALETAEKAKTDAQNALSSANQRLSALEHDSTAALSRATKRGDDFKARIDLLSSDLGKACAERDTHRDQGVVLTESRDEALAAVAEAKIATKDAENRAERWEAAEAEARGAKERQLRDARAVVAASLRAVLAESLESLIATEQHEARVASRKADQFKEIVNGYYHRFGEKLLAQLAQAATALETLGGQRVDVAKLVSQYVADSRTRLNNVFHATPRADLRVAVRKETESWEGRQQTLIDWIGG